MEGQSKDTEKGKGLSKKGRKTKESKNQASIAIRRLWWKIHARLPNIIPSPFPDDREYVIERDEKENIETRVSPNEQLELACMWGAEVYGPSEIESLYCGLQNLNWDKDRWRSKDRAVIDWIREQRSYGAEGSYSIGVVSRPGDANWISYDHQGPLPIGVEYLIVKIYQISPSLTCVLIAFVFDEEAARQYEKAINTDRRTTNKRIKGMRGYSILGVEQLKRAAVDDLQIHYRESIVNWFEKNLPGFFCNSTNGNRLPTAELITTKCEKLFSEIEERKKETNRWRELFSLGTNPYVWACRTNPELRFVEKRSADDMRFHVIASIPTEALSENDLEHCGGKCRAAYISYCNSHLSGVLSRFAALSLLRETRRELSLQRENLKASESVRNNALKILRDAEGFFGRAGSVPIIADELAILSNSSHSFRFYCSEFLELYLFGGDLQRRKYKLSYSFKRLISNNTKKLIVEERATRDIFIQLSNAMSTRESIRTQVRMERFTKVAIAIGMFSALVALAALLRPGS